MITADQLVCHGIGDYILQSHWMATTKTKKSVAALLHALFYSLPFLFLTTNWKSLAFICGTHFLIDRWRLARFVVWVKNFLVIPRIVEENKGPHTSVSDWHLDWGNPPFRECAATGYSPDTPAWLATWLLIIVDNLMHVLCNGIALHLWG